MGKFGPSFRLDYQSVEVAWYRAHGKHVARVSSDSSGQPYIIGDSCWHRRNPSKTEYIEGAMEAAIAAQLTTTQPPAQGKE